MIARHGEDRHRRVAGDVADRRERSHARRPRRRRGIVEDDADGALVASSSSLQRLGGTAARGEALHARRRAGAGSGRARPGRTIPPVARLGLPSREHVHARRGRRRRANRSRRRIWRLLRAAHRRSPRRRPASSPRPSASRTTAGVPHAIASSTDRPKVSWSPAWTKASALASTVASSLAEATKGWTTTRSLGRRRRRPGADGEQQVGRAEAADRVGEDVEVLLRREAAGVDEHARVVGPAAARAPVGGRAPRAGTPSCRRRAAGRRRARRPSRRGGARHAAARREDEVEAAVDVARIALGPARRARAEATAAGEPRHRDDVRVAVGDRRDAEPLRRVARAPGDAVRVAGLDQVGSEAGEDARDRGAAQRQAIAAAARQRRSTAASPRRRRCRRRAEPRSNGASAAGRPASRAWSAGSGARRRRSDSRTSSCRRGGAVRSSRRIVTTPRAAIRCVPGSTVEKRERAVAGCSGTSIAAPGDRHDRDRHEPTSRALDTLLRAPPR